MKPYGRNKGIDKMNTYNLQTYNPLNEENSPENIVKVAQRLRDKRKILENLIKNLNTKTKNKEALDLIRNSLVKITGEIISETLPGTGVSAIFIKILEVKQPQTTFVKKKPVKDGKTTWIIEKATNQIPFFAAAKDLQSALKLIQQKDKDFFADKETSLSEAIEYLLSTLEPMAAYLVYQLNNSTFDLDAEFTKSGIWGFRKDVSVKQYVQNKLESYITVRSGLIYAIENWLTRGANDTTMPLLIDDRMKQLIIQLNSSAFDEGQNFDLYDLIP